MNSKPNNNTRRSADMASTSLPPATDMDRYDAALVPVAFGLNNTGAICYLNSFLQMLAGCSAFVRAVLQNADYLARSRTGKAVLDFVRAFATQGGPRSPPDSNVAFLSASVLSALTADLAARRPYVRFGAGQESASEALVHLLDMMDPPQTSVAAESSLGAHVTSIESPITRLFLHRFRCDLVCRQCQKVVSVMTDYAVVFHLFYFDRLRRQPATPDDFAKALKLHVTSTDDYQCPECKKKTTAFRVYHLTMSPEIMVCAFNIYVGKFGHGERRARYFPERQVFPSVDRGSLTFRIVGQIEHSGSLSSGHYWARGLRNDGVVYRFNDTGVSPASFVPTPETYMVAYHYESSAPPDGVAAH